MVDEPRGFNPDWNPPQEPGVDPIPLGDQAATPTHGVPEDSLPPPIKAGDGVGVFYDGYAYVISIDREDLYAYPWPDSVGWMQINAEVEEMIRDFSWNSLTDVPTEFPSAPHNHDALYVKRDGTGLTDKLMTIASVAAEASINVPHGTAPTTPVNGDLWSTTGDLTYRLNGGSYTVAFKNRTQTFAGKQTMAAGTTTAAGFAILPGVAPTTPVNGDFWTTTTDLLTRLNGVTRTFWHTGNFDPASKADKVPTTTQAITNAYTSLPTGMTLVDGTGGVDGLPAFGVYVTWNLNTNRCFTFAGGADGELWFRTHHSTGFDAGTGSNTGDTDLADDWSVWKRVWTTGNFDPASKANASHTHAIGDVTNLQTTLNLKLEDAPVDGDTYGRKNGAWVKAAGAAQIQDAAPATGDVGTFWWSSLTGQLAIRYNDGNTTQWVGLNGSLSTAVTISDNAPASPYPGLLWWSSLTGELSIRYNDGDSEQWVSAFGGGVTPFKGARVTNGATQSLASGVAVPVNFNQEYFDTSGFHDNAVNNTRLTVPAGVSFVEVTAQAIYASSAVTFRYIDIIMNQADVVCRARYTPQDTAEMTITSGPIAVVPGDYFEFRMYQITGAALNNGLGCWFAIKVLG